MDEVEERITSVLTCICELASWTQKVLQAQKEMWLSVVYDTRP